MSVTFSEILAVARAGHVALTSETAGYLVLGAADRLARAPAVSFAPADIEVDERGTVTVPGVRPAARDEAGGLLRSALRDLLGLAPPGALALSRIGSASEECSAPRLVFALEAALIPVNRAAARRALARLHRDVTRARERGVLAAAPVGTAPAPNVIEMAAPAELTRPADSAPLCTPAVVLPPVDIRPDEAVGDAWESLPLECAEPVRSEPEATPFLGSWSAATRDGHEHDTDLAPPVVVDDTPEPELPEPPREALECTQIQFATMVAPGSESASIDEPASEELDQPSAPASLLGPTWTPVVAAEVVATTFPADFHDGSPSERALWIGAILAPLEDDVPDTVLADEGRAVPPSEEEDDWAVLVPTPSAAPTVLVAKEDDLAVLVPASDAPPAVGTEQDDRAVIVPSPSPPPSAAMVPAEEADPCPGAAERDDAWNCLEPLANERAMLVPARGKGWTGFVLAPVVGLRMDDDAGEPLLDGSAVASVPAPAEIAAFSSEEDDPSEAPVPVVELVDVEADTAAPRIETATATGHEGELCGEIEVTYEDESPQPNSVEHVEYVPLDEAFESPASAATPGLDDSSDAIMDWVVRDEEVVEPEAGIELASELHAPDFDLAHDRGFDRATEFYDLAAENDDLGVIEWIKCGEPLADTPCEVPFPRYDPREERAIRTSLAPLWSVAVEDVEAIDAGWEIEPEAPLPPAVSESPPVDAVVARLAADQGSSDAPTLSAETVEHSNAAAAGAPVEPEPSTATPPPYQPRRSDVTELLAGFTVADDRSLREMSRELKLIAGVAVTPLPPGTTRPSGDGS